MSTRRQSVQDHPDNSDSSSSIKGQENGTPKSLHEETEKSQVSLIKHGQACPPIDPKAEARLLRKLDLYLIPTVSVLYLFCFIDRANVGKSASPPCHDTRQH
ncbi:hypothetical protein BROUX41_002933 [Berkeleyomyces rouxiae]